MYEEYRDSPEQRSPRRSLPDTLYYDAPYNLYGIAFSHAPTHANPRVALTSFISSSASNKISIIQANSAASTSKEDFRVLTTASHPYPPTKIGFEPVNPLTATSSHRGKGSSGDTGGAGNSELLATTGDLLRIWELQEDWNASPSSRRVGENGQYDSGHHGKEKNPWRDDAERPSFGDEDANQPGWRLKERSKLSNSKSAATKLPPLTSFSWNAFSPSSVVTSSIDTTCTIWDISTSTALTQLIAHDRSVYDVSFLPMSKDVFVSVGADGSLRAFDLRALEHSTILYETPAAKAASPTVATSGHQSRHQATDSIASTATTTSIPNKPLARISFSQKEQHYLAIFGFGDTAASILDMRNPAVPVAELMGHQKGLSAVAWGCESRANHGGGGWVATCALPYPSSTTSSATSSPASTTSTSRHGMHESSSTATARPSEKATKQAGSASSSGVSSPVMRQTLKKMPAMAWTTDDGEVNNLAWGKDGDDGAWIGAVSSKRLTCLRF
ncbi:hypothetical protein QFC24_005545 [Naganishia onofrii]|uniref:Uncharacterized protein n=1 Tax=Naganishia onofrii TaxID=1851511 RepID=A0ACC2X968_9TREE|nr:hypothetical protein QFC24_005545 [Naganishia onofrii]